MLGRLCYEEENEGDEKLVGGTIESENRGVS